MTDDRKCITFFPWMRLTRTIQMGRVTFLPFNRQQASAELRPVVGRLDEILSSYRDIEGKPIQACVVALLQGRSPDAALSEDDVGEIQKASGLLALAAFAQNDYFSPGGSYVNSTMFAPYYQGYGREKSSLSLTVRRRDGRSASGGWRHGEVFLVVPVECAGMSDVDPDEGFAKSLTRAESKGWLPMRRVVPAVSFFLLANTDSPLMTPRAEAILTAAAFDQLFQTQKANQLADRVGGLLEPYGCVIADSQYAKARMSRGTGASSDWFLSKVWAQEFYIWRNMLVHGHDTANRKWYWSLGEHLLMAAFAFPLLVKLLLANDGLYRLTNDDEARCTALDKLLAIPYWAEAATAPGRPARWQEIIRQTTLKCGVEGAFEEAKRRQNALDA